MSDSPQYQSIKEWSIDDRPREKMMTKGRQSLSDSELLRVSIQYMQLNKYFG